jgi:hypothetical protein
MIPFTLSALNASRSQPPPLLGAPMAPSAPLVSAAPEPVAAAPAPVPEPARDPTARLAAALAKAERANRKKKE